ncbi:methyl-accepting chemotaxis protein [Leptothoe sp. PORK10 BA2]|uniref:methyl-accepting chemotaxis protein n=1 Tax=Leptothoe sp. PORK10 BA2 TaxID=3110254 RepID=UPI002B2140E6|nr:methyl-accepting chemotaxis protein [Leptothoe sp. PORK10 BA2]MEA5466821.1 methyl-accepting chemotaxis protein [Leptothoe sp. PORK10 BA2]
MPFSKSFIPPKPSLSIDPTSSAQASRQRLKQTVMESLRLNSFAGKLFWMIMLGALSGVGGMAFLFSEMVKYQAEDQVRSTLDGKVNAISSVTAAAETLASGLSVSAITLHERQAQYPDTYRELTLQLFEKRPEFVVGLGVSQSKNGLIANQPWFFPYYWTTSEDPSIQYENFADNSGEFYPESDRYEQYFVSRRTAWTEPYGQGPNQLLTYYLPLMGSDGRWLGTTLVDIDIQYLGQLLNDTVFHKMGHFLLLTRSGNVVVDPSNPENNLKTHEEIAGLKELWPNISRDNKTGFLEGENGYWAYAEVPGQDWLVLGFVPYAAVFNRIALITLLATALMVTLLSIAICLAIRSLNRHLRPVLNQCNQLAETDSGLLAQWNQEDDLTQLSLAFFNMLERLNLDAETIRRHEQKIEQETLHAGQVSEQFEDLTHFLRRHAGKQQRLARDGQQRLNKIAHGFQSVDSQLDTLSTLGRSLHGEVRRLPVHSTEILTALVKQVDALKNVIELGGAPSPQLQFLTDQVVKSLLTLQSHDRRWPSVEQLQQQTGEIAQVGQVASEEAQALGELVQSMTSLLAEIEQNSTTLVRRSQSVSQ